LDCDASRLDTTRLLAFKIELGTIETIPVIGSFLRDIITGGGAVNTMTVQHLYTLHSYVLSIGAVILAIIHLGGVLLQNKRISKVRIELNAVSPPN
jgi:cytochrome b6